MIGLMAGSFGFGVMSDKFGRKNTLIAGLVIPISLSIKVFLN